MVENKTSPLFITSASLCPLQMMEQFTELRKLTSLEGGSKIYREIQKRCVFSPDANFLFFFKYKLNSQSPI